MPPARVLAVLFCLLLEGTASAVAFGDKSDSPRQIKHQITGLFSTDREQDLREAVQRISQVKLVSIDFKNAEATFEYDAAKLFPNAKPDEVVQKLDGMLRTASSHTFGIKPLRTTPLDKLQLVEIPVVGLDCKACCLAAYEAIYKLDGVERATASFREGRVTALIDPEKTDRAKLEAALVKRGVQVKTR
jgi:copper chaperone CopZ